MPPTRGNSARLSRRGEDGLGLPEDPGNRRIPPGGSMAQGRNRSTRYEDMRGAARGEASRGSERSDELHTSARAKNACSSTRIICSRSFEGISSRHIPPPPPPCFTARVFSLHNFLRPRSHPGPGAPDLGRLVDGESKDNRLHRARAPNGQVGNQGHQRLGIPLASLRGGRDARRKEAQHGLPVAAGASGNQANSAGRRSLGGSVSPPVDSMAPLSPPPYSGGEVSEDESFCAAATCVGAWGS